MPIRQADAIADEVWIPVVRHRHAGRSCQFGAQTSSGVTIYAQAGSRRSHTGDVRHRQCVGVDRPHFVLIGTNSNNDQQLVERIIRCLANIRRSCNRDVVERRGVDELRLNPECGESDYYYC